MKLIRFRRALGFALLLYLATFVIVTILALVFRINLSASSPDTMPLVLCILNWIVTIPVVLMFAKWYFRKFQPSLKRGAVLGIFTLVIFYILDTTMLLVSTPNAWEIVKNMYTDWKFYISIVVVLGTTMYAGFEFDKTYTFDEDSGLNKK